MTDPAVPADLAQWSLHCFCLTARRNPKRIIELDNNGEILLSAASGKTRAEIEAAGIPTTESQLVLLEMFGLIERRDDHVSTRIPIVPPGAISVIREVAATAARHALPRVSKASSDIVSVLASRDLEASAHAVVFGHGLDGIFWDSLRQRGLLPETEITAEEPFWRGAVWAVYPGRPGSSGTNEVSIGHHHLVMVWDEGSAQAFRNLESNLRTRALLENIEAKTQRVSVSSIVDEGGDIPVITGEDEIQSLSVELAEEVAGVMPNLERCRELLEDCGVVASAEEAAVIVAHELIWEMAEMLARSDLVSPPDAGDMTGRVFVRVDH